MGMIINIDEALKLRTDYNVLKEPLNKMLADQQEAWERQNPIDLLFARNTISSFQETFTSSIGFDRAFTETADYSIGPIFNTAEGFAATYRTRTFQGSFIISQQAMEDRMYGKIKDDANAFVRRWHGDIVEYALKNLEGGFGAPGATAEKTDWIGGDGVPSHLQMNSADTISGDITDPVKCSLFNKEHKTVKRGVEEPLSQGNMFSTSATDTSAIKFDGSDPLYIAKLADVINQVIVKMENYRDDNGKRAGVLGAKTIVAPNDPHLKAAISAALSMPEMNGLPNMAYQRATLDTTPYLNDIGPCADGAGFFIVDKAYNAANHGPELTERVAFTLDVTETKRPNGIVYDGRQRFDINCASWRGIAYVRVKDTVAASPKAYAKKENFEVITPLAVAKPVSVVGSVKTTT
jgi:hypothetical protein